MRRSWDFAKMMIAHDEVKITGEFYLKVYFELLATVINF